MESFDLLVDIQTFHAIYTLGSEALVRSMASLLRPKGLALVVTGNDRVSAQKTNGPSVLSKEDLLNHFLKDDLFTLVNIEESRFDKTAVYADNPPLCWVALFEKKGSSPQTPTKVQVQEDFSDTETTISTMAGSPTKRHVKLSTRKRD
jgi:hypothetical protein